MTDLPPLRDVLAAHGLTARKSLGQHFLLDLNLTGRIARASGRLSQTAAAVTPPTASTAWRNKPAPPPPRSGLARYP